jgi:hypothetical protein
VTITDTDIELTPTQRSLMHLDTAESQAAATIALGRRLLAEPDLRRPVMEIDIDIRGERLGLRIWAARRNPEAVSQWAEFLGVPLTTYSGPTDPLQVHWYADGDLDGVPLHVWTISREPITNVAVCEKPDLGWHVSYAQGGRRRTLAFPSEAQARVWKDRYGQVAAR